MNKIKKLRKDKGLTQRALADLVGVTYSYMCIVENGQREPSYKLLKAISNALDVNVLELKGIDLNDIIRIKNGLSECPI